MNLSWINRQLMVALTIGSIGLVVFGVQPLLYGAYVNEGRVTEGGLGLLAAVEIAAIALSSGLGITLIKRVPVWQVVALGITLMFVGNLLPESFSLYFARGMAGIGGGLLVALAAQSIATRHNVNAASGAFLFLQSLTQFFILQWFSVGTHFARSVEIERILAGLAVAMFLLLPLLPKGVQTDHPLQEEMIDGTGMPASGLLALMAAGLFQGSAVGLWAYLGLWLQSRGVPADSIAPALTASMVGQMAGALIAAALGHRAHSTSQVIVAAVVLLATVGGFVVFGGTGLAGWLLVVAFGVAWMVATPALAGFVRDVDTSRRSLPYLSTAQLLGAASLPTLVGLMVSDIGLDGVMLTCGIGTIVSIIAVTAAYVSRPRQLVPGGS
jgi:hypothetical protein